MFTRVKMRTRHCIRVAGLLVWCGVLSCMSCTGSVTALSALLSKRAEGGRCEPGGTGEALVGVCGDTCVYARSPCQHQSLSEAKEKFSHVDSVC